MMMMVILNPTWGLGLCRWVLLNPLGPLLSINHCIEKERSPYVLPLRSIEMEEVYTLGYTMLHRSIIILWTYSRFILACPLPITNIIYIYQPYGGHMCISMSVACSILCYACTNQPYGKGIA